MQTSLYPRAGTGGTAPLFRCGLCVALFCAVGVTEAQSAPALVGEGRAHLAAGRLSAAEAAFLRATRLDSANAEAWNGLGAALNRLDRFTEAFTAQERAVQLDPRHVGLRFNRALVAIELGRFPLAIDDLDWVLQQRPTFAPALTERGTALAAIGDRGAAIAQWERALAADSAYVWPRYYRALQAIADGRAHTAREGATEIMSRKGRVGMAARPGPIVCGPRPADTAFRWCPWESEYHNPTKGRYHTA